MRVSSNNIRENKASTKADTCPHQYYKSLSSIADPRVIPAVNDNTPPMNTIAGNCATSLYSRQNIREIRQESVAYISAVPNTTPRKLRTFFIDCGFKTQ
jgi:hypothetical protein